MQKRDLMSREPVPGDEEQKLIAELMGHTEISMKREALALCSRFLRRKWISPDGFFEVVRVIGMFGSKKRWASRLETAFARQSARIRRAMQGKMLVFYASFNDWGNALRFASARRDLLPNEIAFAIEVFARTGRVREVRRLGVRIDRWLDELHSKPLTSDARHDAGFLWYGLGIYKVQECYSDNWYSRYLAREEAIGHWSAVAAHHPLGPVSAYNAVDLDLSIALQRVNDWIKCVEIASRREFDTTALSLPGNQESLNAEMLTRFNRCRRALERLVPEKRRKELGMDRPSHTN